MKRYLCMAVAAALIPLGAALAAQEAQEPPKKPTIKTVPAQRITTTEGAEVYKTYCAVCHGDRGKGDGPAAKALKTPPADLTTITKRYGGEFPTKTIEEKILADNEPMPIAHGTREMPVWGPIFRKGGGRDVATLATANLLKYLESIQVK